MDVIVDHDLTMRNHVQFVLTVMQTTVNKVSLLHAYYNSSFYPVCADNWSNQWSSGACTSLGAGRPVAMTPMHYPTEMYVLVGNNLVYDISSWQLTGNCTRERVIHLVCMDPVCGIAGGTSPYIIGGVPATDDTWPWTATVLFIGNYRCTAVSIGAGWLMSAAHCFINEYNGYSLANVAKYFTVRLLTTRSSGFSSSLKVVGVKRIVIHPSYTVSDGGVLYYDVALIQLGDVLLEPTINKSLIPVCLPHNDINADTLQTTQCYAVGWGISNPDSVCTYSRYLFTCKLYKPFLTV